MLAYCNLIDPLNCDAAAMYLHLPEEYKQKIKECILKYAIEEALKEQEEGTLFAEFYVWLFRRWGPGHGAVLEKAPAFQKGYYFLTMWSRL